MSSPDILIDCAPNLSKSPDELVEHNSAALLYVLKLGEPTLNQPESATSFHDTRAGIPHLIAIEVITRAIKKHRRKTAIPVETKLHL